LSAITLSTARTYARELAGDEGGNVASSTVTTLLNEFMYAWLSETDDRVWALTSTQVGASLSDDVYASDLSGIPTQSDILHVMQVGDGEIYGTPLERVEVDEILRLISDDVDPDTGSPVTASKSATLEKWAVRRYEKAITPGTAQILVHPIPNTDVYVSAIVRLWPTALSADTDVLPLASDEARVVCRMTAMEVARLNGREPDYIQRMGAFLPDRAQKIMSRRKTLMLPKKREMEEVV